MNIKHILYTIFILLVSIQATVASPAEAEYKKLYESWTLSPDHSQEYHVYKELTLYTHTAMNSTYGETFIKYNPRFQELRINASYTRQKDGTIIKTPDNAFVEVLPKAAAGMPAYNHLKEMVIVHTGLELGATIVLDYSIVSKPGYLPEIDICKTLQKSSPVKDYRLKFVLPQGTKTHYSTIGIDKKPQITNAGQEDSYIWEFQNLPALSRAPEISLQNEDVLGLIFSSYPTSSAAIQKIFNRFDNPSSLAELAKDITEGLTNKKDQLYAIHHFVINNIAFCPLSHIDTDYRFRQAEEVLKSASATEIEKINLLYGLLNSIGIQAVPAAACYINVNPGICALSAIHKWMVTAEIEGNTYYLDATTDRPAARDCNFFICMNNGQVIKNTLPTKYIRYQANIKWEGHKPMAEVKAIFHANQTDYSKDSYYRLISLSEMNFECQQNNIVATGHDKIRCTPVGEYELLSLPETEISNSLHQYEKYNSKRDHNLILKELLDEEYDYEITLPENMSLCSLDTDKSIENKIGHIKISVHQIQNKVHIHKEIKINKSKISPQEYDDFKTLVINWQDQNFKKLLLK